MTRTILFSLSAIALAACATDTGSDSQVERGPLGKADVVSGSCAATDCDGISPEGTCWCDDLCAEYGDCCSDKVHVCEAPVAPSCGGFAGFTCADDMYCHYEQAERCGAADQMGTCRVPPGACIEEFLPVCGCDGQTYSNSCFAAQAGASVVHDGGCQ